MVLYDPMERPLLQLVTSHPATDKKLFPRRAPPWAGDVSRLSDAQLKSAHAFTQFAINNLRGVTGTESFNGNEVSSAAVRVAEDYPNTGAGAFGGLTPQERRQQRYSRAERNRDKLTQIAQQRNISLGASPTGPARSDGGNDTMFTDGGEDQEQGQETLAENGR